MKKLKDSYPEYNKREVHCGNCNQKFNEGEILMDEINEDEVCPFCSQHNDMLFTGK
jgi:hypothetical protein